MFKKNLGIFLDNRLSLSMEIRSYKSNNKCWYATQPLFFPPLFLVSIFIMIFVSSYLCYVHVFYDQPIRKG